MDNASGGKNNCRFVKPFTAPIYIEQIDQNIVKMSGYTMESIYYLRNLESNTTSLIEKYGARECAYCFGIKIDCFPFFTETSNICTDCEDKLKITSEVIQ